MNAHFFFFLLNIQAASQVHRWMVGWAVVAAGGDWILHISTSVLTDNFSHNIFHSISWKINKQMTTLSVEKKKKKKLFEV